MNQSNKIKNMLRIRYELPLETYKECSLENSYGEVEGSPFKAIIEKIKAKLEPALAPLSEDEQIEFLNELFGFDSQSREPALLKAAQAERNNSLGELLHNPVELPANNENEWAFYKDDLIFSLVIGHKAKNSSLGLRIQLEHGNDKVRNAVRVVDGFSSIIIDRLKK